MKIGILTHYTINNLGAQLQLYALHNYLKERGYEVVVETYRKNYDFDISEIEKRNEISIRSIRYIITEFLIKEGINFCHYARDHVDIVIVGSDEVFSLQYGVNTMMYGHGVNADYLVAYAPSIGQTDMKRIVDKRCVELISSGLKMFSSLSTRDEHTYEIVKTLTKRNDIELVCDPVLLYDFSGVYTEHKRIKEKYLIAYSYDRYFMSDAEIRAIKSYANAHNLKVASIGTYHKWCDYNITMDRILQRGRNGCYKHISWYDIVDNH